MLRYEQRQQARMQAPSETEQFVMATVISVVIGTMATIGLVNAVDMSLGR